MSRAAITAPPTTEVPDAAIYDLIRDLSEEYKMYCSIATLSAQIAAGEECWMHSPDTPLTIVMLP